jgi:hypothetical protein
VGRAWCDGPVAREVRSRYGARLTDGDGAAEEGDSVFSMMLAFVSCVCVCAAYTTRKSLIAGAPKTAIAGAPAPAGGNRPVVMAYHRRTSWCAGGNTSYPRRTCLVHRQ